MSLSDAGAILRVLHRPGDPFLLANAWDAGSARLLAGMGAKAIGTTSAGLAFTLGRPDGGRVSRDETLSHVEALVRATSLPISADLENGFGASPDMVADTIRLAAEAGAGGGSIEDTDLPGQGAYGRELAVERVRAGVAAARALRRDFVFVARADGVMMGSYDLEEGIARIQAFEAAGADCVYIPLPGTPEDLARVVRSVNIPVNALAVGPLGSLSRADFAALGVARISLGSKLASMTQRVLYDAGMAMLTQGRFDTHPMIASRTVNALLAGQAVSRP